MNRMMITGTNTLAQLQKQLDITSHNMANVDTVGYKRREAKFADLVFQHFNNQPLLNKEVNRHTPYGIRQGVGAKIAQSQLISTQGSLKRTDRPLDLALTKENQYFAVSVQDGDGEAVTRLTRDGAFYLTPINDEDTMLVSHEGNLILDENMNPIVFRGKVNNFNISETGQIQAEFMDGRSELTNLAVYQVHKPQFLEQKGSNLLSLPDNAAEIGAGEADIMTLLNGANRNTIGVAQHTLEHSNVHIGEEMTDLITTQRAYQFQARTVTMADQMLGLINGIR